MIVKLQRPMFPPNGPWMAYDKKHKFEAFIDPSKIEKRVLDLMGDAPKGYFEAELRSDGQLEILRKVADGAW